MFSHYDMPLYQKVSRDRIENRKLELIDRQKGKPSSALLRVYRMQRETLGKKVNFIHWIDISLNTNHLSAEG